MVDVDSDARGRIMAVAHKSGASIVVYHFADYWSCYAKDASLTNFILKKIIILELNDDI